jgi:DNA repair protein RadC
MTKNYSLQSLPPEERPRERLKQLGAENLSLQELLALIIERGNKKQNVLQLSQELISHFGNLDNIKNASLKELKQIKGIGPATACKIKAALEIGKRGGKSFRQYQQEIKKPVDVFKLLKPLIGDKKKEHFVLLSLDTKNHIIGLDTISIGSLNISLAHPREIFQTAIKNSAATIILAHNHPSGDPTPSDNDLKITKRLLEISKLLGIRLVDHIIITEEKYYSFIGEK